MVNFKDFDETKMVDYTDDDLKEFYHEVEKKKSVLKEQCSEEMSILLKNDKFDVYSWSGSRKIKKIADKYAGLIAVADDYLKTVGNEMRKREKFEEEQRYSGKSIKKRENISQEEFLQKEEDKTWAYRSKIE